MKLIPKVNDHWFKEFSFVTEMKKVWSKYHKPNPKMCYTLETVSTHLVEPGEKKNNFTLFKLIICGKITMSIGDDRLKRENYF